MGTGTQQAMRGQLSEAKHRHTIAVLNASKAME